MIYKATEENIKKAGEILKNGGVVAIPTETVYGLAANALDSAAVAKIFAAKGRPADNPLIVHITKAEDIEKYAYPNEKAFALAKRFWPGPLTMILPKKDCIPSIVSAGLETVAIRCPSHPTARAVIDAAGVPLAAPSANISGKPSATTAEHVRKDFGENIDAIIDGGSCDCGVESTVVTVATEPPILLRPGFVTPEQLREVLPDLKIAEAVTKELPKGAKALSPGMKHKHYAPKAEAYAVLGSTENAVEFILKRISKEKRTAVICFDGEEKNFEAAAEVFTFGSENDSEKQASKIFDLLRELDDDGVEEVFIRIGKMTGVGLAVYNRLIRACEFRIFDADGERKCSK